MTTSKFKSHTSSLVFAVSLSVFLPSCKLPEALVYHPKVSLQKSLVLIDRKILVKDFVDSRPSKDTSTTKIDFRSVTHRPNFYGKLSNEIENAIISDLSKNQVFSRIGKDVVDPDYILTGEVKEFKGQARPTIYGAISFYSILGVYTWFLGMPVSKQETESGLNINIYNLNGDLVGTYVGKASKVRRKSIYGSKKFAKALPGRTNETFSNSVMQIREQILKDLSKFDKN
jgi:hypothetical protein